VKYTFRRLARSPSLTVTVALANPLDLFTFDYPRQGGGVIIALVILGEYLARLHAHDSVIHKIADFQFQPLADLFSPRASAPFTITGFSSRGRGSTT